MAKTNNNIFGPISGKMGGMVYSSWNGIQVVKKLPAPGKKGRSPAQLEQQARFSLLIHFLKPISPILNRAFEKSRLRMTGFNKVVSENKHAITGTYPDLRIDYAKIILCKKIAFDERAVTATAGPDGKLIFELDKNALYGMFGSSTIFFIAAYEEVSRRWIYKMDPELSDNQPFETDLNPLRSKGVLSCELDLSPFHSRTVHTYAGIMPPVGKFSGSLYTGMITVE